MISYPTFRFTLSKSTRWMCLLSILFAALAQAETCLQQSEDALVAKETWAVAYSGFRKGQHPDRGNGAKNPTDAQVLEDLELLQSEGFNLIRMYDSGENTKSTLEIIRDQKLPMKMLLGVWLKAEASNHETCGWLTEPIPEAELTHNTLENDKEVARAIALAKEFPEIIVAINVGNECLVEWNDHAVSVDRIISIVHHLRSEINQQLTVADNYLWWAEHGEKLAKELDFIGVHSYPVWEGKSIDEGMPYTLENLKAVRKSLPDAKIAILEAGWASHASEFGERASESIQKRYYNELKDWAYQTNTTVFFFEAFDEPWKGNEANPDGAEKHWGIFFENRTPKAVIR